MIRATWQIRGNSWVWDTGWVCETGWVWEIVMMQVDNA